MIRASFVAFAFVLAAAACGSDDTVGPAGDFAEASATATCGPADGPAVAIQLTPNEGADDFSRRRFVTVTIPRSVGDIAGRTWPVDGGSDAAWSTLIVGASSAAIQGVGEIVILRADTSSTVDGVVDVLFANGVRVRGTFSADWVERRSFCG
jgi:hypothetical protein